jgi:long-chain acyl-CoA synthetase
MNGQAKQLTTLFFESVAQNPGAIAVRFCDKKADVPTWRSWTWEKYADEVRMVAGWLRQKGITRGDRVAILSGNRPEWIVADLATLSLGAVSVPIYATSSAKDISYILEHSESKALFIDHISRLKDVTSMIPTTKVEFDAGGFDRIREDKPSPIIEPESMNFDDLATIIYTSGTTGLPKGVIHTHGTVAEAAFSASKVLNDASKSGPDRFFSFLPLSHVAERLLVEIGSIATGSEVVFARGVETLIDDLKAYPPTILLCVPRLWERVHERIRSNLKTTSKAKRAVFELALKAGSVRIEGDRIFKSKDASIGALLSDALVGKKLRKSLGMDRVRIFLTGSAPTQPNILKFFGSFGIFIREVYGLTENLCLGVYTPPQEIVIGVCGTPFPSNEVQIREGGEIFFRAPFNFKGYFKNPEATAEILFPDGWMATGDLGEIDDKGFLKITGRKKELLKTSTGKYVAPVPIETELKKNPLIADAMIIGDNQKYCIALLSLDLSHTNSDTVDQDLKCLLEEVNTHLANHESIKRIGILKTGFSVEDGTLTPTLKLKRKAALAKYAAFVAKIYSSRGTIIRE